VTVVSIRSRLVGARVKLAQRVKDAFKRARQEQKRNLRELQSEAVEWFLSQRVTNTTHYLTAPDNAVDWPLRLPLRVAIAAKKRAKEDGVSANRVIYTAFIRYAEEQLQPTEPVVPSRARTA
jgi:hypothetical protein